MNAHSRKMRSLSIRSQREFDRQGEANAREVDMIIARGEVKILELLATTERPNGAFQQRLRSILYDDIQAKLIVTIHGQLRAAALQGWNAGLTGYLESVPRELWLNWARYKSGQQEATREGYDPNEKRDSHGRWTTGADSKAIAKEHAGRWTKALSTAEQNAVRWYTTGKGYTTVNNALRKCGTSRKCFASRADYHNFVHLYRAIEKAGRLPKPITIYRGVRGEFGERLLAACSQPDAIGKALQTKGFGSATVSSEIASGFATRSGIVLQIKAKTGAYIAGMSKNSSEQEFLQQIGKKYKLLKVEHDVDFNGVRRSVIHLEELTGRRRRVREACDINATLTESTGEGSDRFVTDDIWFVDEPVSEAAESATLTEMMHWLKKWDFGKVLDYVIDFAELLRGKDLPKDNWLALVRKYVFPPPSKERVEEIMRSDRWPDRKTWPQRLQREGFSFDSIVNQVSTSLSQGKAVREVEKDIAPLVGNYRVKARRIARTESIRVMQSMQREADQPVQELIYARQIKSVGDERVRPEHAKRDGTIYYKTGWGPQDGKSLAECPETPDAPNCRCVTYPLFIGVDDIGLGHFPAPSGDLPANVRGMVQVP